MIFLNKISRRRTNGVRNLQTFTNLWLGYATSKIFTKMRMEPPRIIPFAMSTDSSVLLKRKFGGFIKKWIFHLIESG